MRSVARPTRGAGSLIQVYDTNAVRKKKKVGRLGRKGGRRRRSKKKKRRRRNNIFGWAHFWISQLFSKDEENQIAPVGHFNQKKFERTNDRLTEKFLFVIQVIWLIIQKKAQIHLQVCLLLYLTRT